MMQLLLRQARVYDPGSDFHGQAADIYIENGIIKEIAASLPSREGAAEITGKQLCVSPGWTDLFADYREPGYEQHETIASGLAAAAAGGFTRVSVLPNTEPVVSGKSTVQYLIRQAAGQTTTLHPLGAVSKDTGGRDLAEMMDMHTAGAIAFTDGWKPLQHAGLMLKALEYVKAFNGLVIQIPAHESLSKGGLMHEGIVSTRAGMAGIPDIAETLMVHRDIELLRYTGSRLHLTGISSAGSVSMIREAKAEGLDITCSVTPYHLALTDESLSGYDSLYKVMPPLRTEADRQALIGGLKDGTIDCIASHHKPQDWDAKAKEFEYAADGMNLQQWSFQISWEAVKNEVPLERVLDALSARPRHILGIPAPVIAAGQVAELTIFDIFETEVISRGASASANNPFTGQQVTAQVAGIINHENHNLKTPHHGK